MVEMTKNIAVRSHDRWYRVLVEVSIGECLLGIILYFLKIEYGKGGLNICGMNKRVYTGLKNQPELKTTSQLARVFESTKMENYTTNII